MPNSWDHHQPAPDATCIAPLEAPYGRWNIDEIVRASFPAVFLITIWRIIFCYMINLGWHYAVPLNHPHPHPRPAFLDEECDKSKLKHLHQLYYSMELKKSKVPKQKKKPESAGSKSSDLKLTANIKRRNEVSITGERRHRKPLTLPPGLDADEQTPDNLAFLASLDSDSTRRQIPIMMKELDYSLSQIREYYHYQKDYDSMKELANKFNEESWKMITMIGVTCYGVWVMSKEPFFKSPQLLFKEWPQIESWRVFFYYQIAVGYHVHRAVWQFWDKKRKDVIAMFIHHWVTVVLVGSSWYWGIMNIGAVVMVVHDNSDIFLPAAKVSKWLGWNTMKNVSFICFVSSWIFSRIVLFCWKVIIPVFMFAPSAYSCHYYKFVGFTAGLSILLLLHFYWAYLIIKVAVDWICCGSTVEDNRSSDEEDKQEIIIQPDEFDCDDESSSNSSSNNVNSIDVQYIAGASHSSSDLNRSVGGAYTYKRE